MGHESFLSYLCNIFADCKLFRIKSLLSPGWCGSVVEHQPGNHWLDSQSGHMPGLQARSPVGGVGEATTH